MKIISWNLWIDNTNQIRSVKNLLQTLEPEIVCLQEVTSITLEYLKLLDNYQLCHCLDFTRPLNPQRPGNEHGLASYLVILSKYKIDRCHCEAIHNDNPNTFLAKLKGINKPREFQFVDIVFNERRYRIFNIHLEMATGSKRRLEEFNNVLKHKQLGQFNIFCGDFNIFSRPLLNFVIGWGLNLKGREYFMNERRQFNRIFAYYNLINVFKRRVTYPRFRLQLDHILIPNNLQVKAYKVLSSSSSDHRAIAVCI